MPAIDRAKERDWKEAMRQAQSLKLSELDGRSVYQQFSGTAHHARRHIADIDDRISFHFCCLIFHPCGGGRPCAPHHLCIFSQFTTKDQSDDGRYRLFPGASFRSCVDELE